VDSAAQPQRRKAIIDALGHYQKHGSLRDNPEDVAAMLTDESDRGALIIVGTLVEDLLADMIISKLPSGEAMRKELTRQGGALNTFNDKIAVATALNLIDEETIDALDVLRVMRNACAHSRRNITFRTPELLDGLTLLVEEEAAQFLRQTKNDLFIRAIFSLVAAILFRLLSGGTKEQAQAHVNLMSAELLRELRAEKAKLDSL
jgi:hypothetical protein